MSRLQFSPAVAAYLEKHAVDLDLAHELGVRSDRDDILYEYTRPKGGAFVRRRVLETGITKQPSGEPLIPWFPAGRPAAGAEVLLTEGEPDALAALSALNGHPVTVSAIPGTTIPPERLTAELSGAQTVYLAMDGDEPGKKAANEIARALQAYTELRVVELGDGEDLASRLYREEDREGWLRSALEQAPAAPKVKLKAETGGYRRKAADRTRELLVKGIDPNRIELGELLDQVVDFISAYVVLPVVSKDGKEYDRVVADLLALWVIHTWAFDACWATPYLRVVSAAPESAKSLLLEVLASISSRGWLAINPSPAILYRKIDLSRPSLFLDEMDNFALDEKRDALAVLNAGYKPGARVPRCNDRGELEEFDCYCPKAYAGLDARQLVPTLLSRSITIRMETKKPGDHVEMWIAPDVEPKASEIRDRCRAWAERHVDELKGHRPDLVGLVNRQAEVWWILLSLGEQVGGEWTERARAAARVLGAGGDETDRPSQQVQLLTDVHDAFGAVETIFTKELLAFLNGLDESPWGARRRGEGLDARGLSNMLRPFKIKPRSVRVGEETAKGYHLDQFEDAFARYLAPSLSVTSVTPVTNEPQSQAVVTDVTDVTATEGVDPEVEEGAGERTLEDALQDPVAAEQIRASVDGTWVTEAESSGGGGCVSHPAGPDPDCRYCRDRNGGPPDAENRHTSS